MQDDLFSEAVAAKLAGMQRSEAGADQAWSDLMLRLVKQVCLTQLRFTSDDVFDLFDASGSTLHTHDSRAFGPVMMHAAKAGWCRKVNVAPVPSRRKSLHASPRAVWESLIC